MFDLFDLLHVLRQRVQLIKTDVKIRAAEQFIPDLVSFLLETLLSQLRRQYHWGTLLVHVPTILTSVAYANKAPEAEENDGISGDLVQKISWNCTFSPNPLGNVTRLGATHGQSIRRASALLYIHTDAADEMHVPSS